MPARPSANVESPTLLVVDDNDMNRDMLSRRLEKKGYLVRIADNGRRALDILTHETIDLVLLDIEMPGMSGMDVLKEIRRAYNSLELPVIMATARSDSADMVDALGAGANDYVTKPLDFPVVLARVEAQLRTRQRAEARAAAGPQMAPVMAAAAHDVDVGPGKVLADRYRLEAKIGSGAFGAVYRARHVGLDHLVAVKVLQAGAARTPDALARFQREGIAACRIKHANAVAVLDFGITPAGAAFLVMELLDGHGLDEELTAAGKVSPKRAAEIVRSVCDVLSEAHRQGVVHRDIKPANVYLSRTTHGEVVKVLDFGIAKLLDDDTGGRNLTVEGGIIGTPAYMSPERFRGSTPSGSSDVYSVAVMLFQMLTGQMPFTAGDSDLIGIAMLHVNEPPPPLRQLEPTMSVALERVVAWGLAKHEAARPTAAQFSAGLCHAAGVDARPALFLTPEYRVQAAGDPAGAPADTRVARDPTQAPAASPSDPTVSPSSSRRIPPAPTKMSAPTTRAVAVGAEAKGEASDEGEGDGARDERQRR